MISTYQKNGFLWLDIESPQKEEIEQIKKDYSLPDELCTDLQKKIIRSRTDFYENLVYFVLHLPLENGPDDYTLGEEIDFIATKDVLITVHKAPFLMKDIREKFGENATDESNSGDLLSSIVKYLFKKGQDELDSITEKIEEVEDNIFTGKEASMVVVLSELSRRLIDYKQSIQFHRDALMSLSEYGAKIWGKKFLQQSKDLILIHEKMMYGMFALKDTIFDLRATNDSLLTTKTNMTMKKLTVLAFITFPLTLIAGIFGMNTSFDPILGRQGDFWIIMGIMLFVLVTTTLIFKFRKWM